LAYAGRGVEALGAETCEIPAQSGPAQHVGSRQHPQYRDPRSGLSQISWRTTVAHHLTEDTLPTARAAELSRI